MNISIKTILLLLCLAVLGMFAYRFFTKRDASRPLTTTEIINYAWGNDVPSEIGGD